MSLRQEINLSKLPAHVAIIMDGNGRWAIHHGKSRIFGHHQGVESVRKVIEAAAEIGLKYLTLYAFSTENWERPDDEVAALMGIMVQSLNDETETLLKNNIKLTAIGDLDRLDKDVRERLFDTIDITSVSTGLRLTVALSYSSRWEILRAARNIAAAVKDGKLDPESLNDALFEKYLCTADLPDPDLMIRTSGERRISNFLLWQCAYTEFYFTEVLWPDFGKEDFYGALIDFQKRERRFGKTSEQISEK
ncbi:MAG TPA: isoprenyl transferase [Bacteroidales bacterium]|nr:isoprenyl transferase [Bacteroidales bacterium]OQB61933.1 MAG: Ditrans,polycis-undecaprenyl-diphosphate synthase ((2E,6E)-farnesyl-diphosphate specific) [Bacteroidetes bacterium ADurb.Bin145]HOU01901.1 isoprenyl transferase [Bacteroidales bacterium]HQG63804.1 isoprenyl transferase [Bacteroidales bacterium]HQK67325.1 isoprenyl transferase [Bacteroidales bacterium]